VRLRVLVPAIAALALLSSFAFIVFARPFRGVDPSAPSGHAGHMNMTGAEMAEWARAWWASHERVGAASGLPPSATFTAQNFRFDTDGNSATQVDTARILVGQSVRWQWVGGTHTVTNGTGAVDPTAGTLFDQPLDVTDPQFNFIFNTTGTFHFFCRPHEGLNMKGIVIVSTTTGVDRIPSGALGFTSAPAPNPARAGVTFGFAMRVAGRARAEVFDASGRRVAVALDRELGAGPHVGAWDGHVRGRAAGPGLYYLRLVLPGYSESRTIAITH
jgi:plastocyanin